MAELTILDPRVLPRVVQEYEAPETLLGLNTLVAVESDDQPSWEYDIEVHSRGALNRYNTHNTEATLLDQLPVGHMEGSYAYQRVKKSFSPSTLRLLRRVGANEASSAVGEARVVSETNDMRQQIMRGEEYAIWKMMQGSWTYMVESGVSYTINYQIPSSHKVDVANSWGSASDTPIADITGIKRQVARDSGFPIVRAFMNSVTMAKFIELPEVSGGYVNSTVSDKQGQLSDRQKESFQNDRIVPRFHGINWIEYDDGYLDGTIRNGTYNPYIADNMIIFVADGGVNPFKLMYGPSVDDSAPAGWTGLYTKSWKEEDPSARQVLMEIQYMPMLTHPFKVATLNIA